MDLVVALTCCVCVPVVATAVLGIVMVLVANCAETVQHIQK